MISTTQELREFAERVRRAPWITLDTEADSLHAYPEKLCLLQMAIPGEAVLIDPLADIHLEPLWEVLDHREIILHAADYDLRLLYQCHHFAPSAIFDTMWAARLLGQPRFGLNDVLTQLLGITLEKGSQKANWGRRPLTPRMVEYALNDVLHLHDLAEVLRQRLIESNRLEWHRQVCERIIRDSARADAVDRNTIWRIKGHDKLDDLGLAILRELWHWREKEAVRSNKPPFFILNHDVLSAIADYASAHRSLRGFHLPKFLTPRRRNGLLAAVELGLQVPRSDWPKQIRVRTRRMTRPELDKAETLRLCRDAHASLLGIDPTLIASKATLYALGRQDPQAWEFLLPWQRALLETAPPQSIGVTVVSTEDSFSPEPEAAASSETAPSQSAPDPESTGILHPVSEVRLTAAPVDTALDSVTSPPPAKPKTKPRTKPKTKAKVKTARKAVLDSDGSKPTRSRSPATPKSRRARVPSANGEEDSALEITAASKDAEIPPPASKRKSPARTLRTPARRKAPRELPKNASTASAEKEVTAIKRESQSR